MLFHSISRDNNLILVRYYLCMCILMNHFNVLTGLDLEQLPRIFGGVGSFFAISGFLMFASFEKRQDRRRYFSRRARRILPPYVLIVLLAAAALSAVSALPVAEYFASAHTWRYVLFNLAFLNFAEPTLPGVFDANLIAAVNGSLWTMKGEVVCYLLVPPVFALLSRWRSHARALLAAMFALCYAAYLALSGAEAGLTLIIAKQMRMFTFFFAGALVSMHMPLFTRHKWWVVAAAVAMVAASGAGQWMSLALRPFSDSILVIWFAVTGRWGWWASRHDGLSYDMYLFHFPVIQTLICTGALAALGPWPSLVAATALTVLLAAVSWRLVGKPVLNGRMPRLRLPSLRLYARR